MNVRDTIYTLAYNSATLYGLGKNEVYGRLLSAVGIPSAFLLHTIFYKHYGATLFVLLSLTLISFALYYIATTRMEPEEYRHLIIHHLIGVFLMFWAIPCKPKVILFGFIVFHSVTFVHTYGGNPLTRNIPYICDRTRYFLAQVLCGLGMNILLRLVLWIVV
jgi:hypothetical protein